MRAPPPLPLAAAFVWRLAWHLTSSHAPSYLDTSTFSQMLSGCFSEPMCVRGQREASLGCLAASVLFWTAAPGLCVCMSDPCYRNVDNACDVRKWNVRIADVRAQCYTGIDAALLRRRPPPLPMLPPPASHPRRSHSQVCPSRSFAGSPFFFKQPATCIKQAEAFLVCIAQRLHTSTPTRVHHSGVGKPSHLQLSSIGLAVGAS